MYLRYVATKTLAAVYEYVANNPASTIKQVKNHMGICKQQAHQALTALRENGYLSYTGVRGATPAKYYVTDKEFDAEKLKPSRKPRNTKCTEPKQKTVEIEIKPDLAAMWLVKSKPHSVKRSIPIVRSIGLGVRQSTSLR